MAHTKGLVCICEFAKKLRFEKQNRKARNESFEHLRIGSTRNHLLRSLWVLENHSSKFDLDCFYVEQKGHADRWTDKYVGPMFFSFAFMQISKNAQ